jgi:hypothetical protein
MPDGSIVELVRHERLGENGSRCYIRVEQFWPDGRTYDGDFIVERLSDISRLGGQEKARPTG